MAAPPFALMGMCQVAVVLGEDERSCRSRGILECIGYARERSSMSDTTILAIVVAVLLGCLLGMLSSAAADRKRRRREGTIEMRRGGRHEASRHSRR